MSLIWTRNLSVKIEQFDEDHKKLIRFINELQEAIQDAQAKGAIDPVEIEVILHRLENYSLYHFSAEETAMEQTGFPGLEEHRAEHKKFIEIVAGWSERFKESRDPKDAGEIAEFLYNWIVDHVYQIDGKYIDHLHEHEIY
jgi:hemerythrin-like metal-binding protein